MFGFLMPAPHIGKCGFLFLLGAVRGQLWPYMRMHIGSLTIPALNPVEKTTINIVSKWFDL